MSGLIALAAVIVVGLLANRMLVRAAFPWRERLFELGAEQLGRADLSAEDRAFVNNCLDNALSFHAGWYPIRAGYRLLLAEIRGVDLKSERAGPEMPQEVVRVGLHFIVSVMMVNPFALLLSVPLLIALMVAGREAPRPAIRHTAANLRYATC